MHISYDDHNLPDDQIVVERHVYHSWKVLVGPATWSLKLGELQSTKNLKN